MSESRQHSVDIATVLRDARLGDLRWLAEERAPYRDLADSTRRLFDLLVDRRAEFVLVGGLAVLQYVGGRNTRDIDLIMAVSDLARVPELEVESQDGDFARASFEGIQVDLLLTTNALFETVRRNYITERDFSGRALPCATPEGLILLKLFALPSLYRQGEFGRISIYESDIAMLLKGWRLPLEPILAELAPHILPTDLANIRDILADIAARIARFDAGQAEASGTG